MSAGAPAYVSRVQTQNLGQFGAAQQSSGFDATAQAAQGLGQATARFGEALGGFAVQQMRIATAATVADRKTGFYQDLDRIEQEAQNDPDMATMPERYKSRTAEAKARALAGLPAAEAAELSPVLTRQEISYNQGARTLAMRKQADTYTAGVDADYERYTRQYAGAKTEIERTEVATNLDATLNDGVRRGMITAKAAEAYRQGLKTTGDQALALRAIGANPVQFLKQIEDPAYLPGIQPAAREQLRTQAKAAADDLAVNSAVNRARLNPEAAPFIAGRIMRPEQAQGVYNAIVQQESGGRPGAISPQGALGIGQLMPGTAREMAGKLKLPGIQNLDDAELRSLLLSDPALNRQLGYAYFQQNLQRFDGHLAPAIAAYHAGTNSKPVMEAHLKARELYGDTYTPAQFAALLPDGLADKDKNGNPAKKTKDYVLDVFRRMGADPAGVPVSGAASWRIASGVDGVLQQVEAQQRQILSQLVQSGGREADALRPIMTEGFQVDPQRFAGARAALAIGAAKGDATAADKLQQLDEAAALRPVVQQAWGMRPEVLTAEAGAIRQQMAAGRIVQPEDHRRLKVLESVASAQAEMRKTDSIGLGYRQGLAPAEVIPSDAALSNPDLRMALARRSAVSDRSFAVNGGERAFFQPQELQGWKTRWSEMGEQDRFDTLKLLSETASSEDAYRAAVRQLTGGEQIAATAGRFLREKPELARDILRGSALLEHPSVKPKTDDLRKTLAGKIGGDLYPPEVQKDMIDAALAVYAAERGKTGALYDASDASGLETALEKVIGRTVRRNGVRVPLPDTVPERAFADAMDRLSKPALDAFGGARGGDGRELDAGYVGRHARLKPAGVGDGRYYVTMPGGREDRPVMTKDGAPLVIDIARVVAIQRVLAGATAQGRRNAAFAEQARQDREALGLQPQGPQQ